MWKGWAVSLEATIKCNDMNGCEDEQWALLESTRPGRTLQGTYIEYLNWIPYYKHIIIICKMQNVCHFPIEDKIS